MKVKLCIHKWGRKKQWDGELKQRCARCGTLKTWQKVKFIKYQIRKLRVLSKAQYKKLREQAEVYYRR